MLRAVPRLSGVVAASLLLACTNNGGGTATNQQAERDGFSAVVLQGESNQQSHAFVEEQIYECMKSEGFEYELKSFQPEDPSLTDSRELREQQGFGHVLGVQGKVEKTSLETGPQKPDGYLAEESKCSEQGFEELNRATVDFLDGLDPEAKASFDAVANFESPKLVEASQNWADCMNKEGHNFPGPAEMYEYMSSNFTSESDLPAETSLALADWDCSKTDDVEGLVDEAYAELDSQLSDQFNERLQE